MSANTNVLHLNSEFYTVERAVPKPERKDSSKLAPALRKLSVGDSMLIPLEFRERVYTYAERVGISVTCKTLPKSPKGAVRAVRVWRVA